MKRNKWFLLLVLYFGAVMVGFNQMKVPTLMNVLAAHYDVELTTVSYLMSGFTVAGIFLALPSAMVVNRLGLKKTGLILMGCLAAGSFIGAAAPSFSVLLIGRMLEGISYAFMILFGAMLINRWFPENQVGLAMGIFTTFPTLGPMVVFNLAPKIAAEYGWQSLWVALGVMSLVALVLYALFIEVPPAPAESAPAGGGQPSVFSGFANTRAWLLALAQGVVAFILFAYMTVYPLIFQNFYGLPAETSNYYASFTGFFGIASCVVAGWLVSKSGKPALMISIGFAGLVVVGALTFKLTPSEGVYLTHVLGSSFFTGLVIPAVLTLAAKAARTPAEISTVVGMINFIYYIGVFAGTPVITAMSEGGKTSAATLPLAGAAFVGLLSISAFILISRKQKSPCVGCPVAEAS